jgi:23S rRNA (adenine2030-N6)-methyltransferase
MLSYRHIFHAGNHADIFKHTTLIMLLEHLNEKDKPYTVIDTHAGAGRYDLNDECAQKTGEAEKGIKKLLANPALSRIKNAVPEICTYTDFAGTCLSRGFYPGSPEIERSFMRDKDCLILCELHNTEIDVLKGNVYTNKGSGHDAHTPRIQIHHRSGYEALYALTPPLIKRGLVFTDPSYEDATEYNQASKALSEVHDRWPAAVLALWYPLLAHRKIECSTMKQKITASVKSSSAGCDILDAQLLVNTEDSHIETPLGTAAESSTPRLYGSGMFIVNPPWKLDEKLKSVLSCLAETLGTGSHGSYSVKIL